jgi:hypothetical protein
MAAISIYLAAMIATALPRWPGALVRLVLALLELFHLRPRLVAEKSGSTKTRQEQRDGSGQLLTLHWASDEWDD